MFSRPNRRPAVDHPKLDHFLIIFCGNLMLIPWFSVALKLIIASYPILSQIGISSPFAIHPRGMTSKLHGPLLSTTGFNQAKFASGEPKQHLITDADLHPWIHFEMHG